MPKTEQRTERIEMPAQVADRTGYWWLCIECGHSGETFLTLRASKADAELHDCDDGDDALLDSFIPRSGTSRIGDVL